MGFHEEYTEETAMAGDASGRSPRPRAPEPVSRRIPTPAEVQAAHGGAVTPMVIDPRNDGNSDAVYLVDTCVGLSIIHARLVADVHAVYGERLFAVEDVLLEARRLERLTHRDVQSVRVQRAARMMRRDLVPVFGRVIRLDVIETVAIEALRAELATYRNRPPQPGDTSSDRGECASVRAGEMLRREGRVAVLLTNDGLARRIAMNHGLACRTIVGVLQQLVRNGRLTSDEAFAAYKKSAEVSGLPHRARPRSAADFC
jgi:hypothetical protein